MSEAYQREVAIFEKAINLPPDERAEYLNRACEGNPELRHRIESLLKSSESQGGFLDTPGGSCQRQLLHSTVPLTEKPGDQIGRYKLLEQIGEGGCGVVYVAEQTEPVRRKVALKVIKLGMDTKSVIARFESERQALALMDHPNIAKVLDAGATETGRPFFVMELVRGVRITDYCDQKCLSTHARLELFIKVCQAIQHAHHKGIVHRDIKPSNILVTINDGVAVPKVIDFGVAKATTGEQLTDKTVYTAFEQFIGTPAYMSPEQAVMTSLDIDTRSDIYALGVLLYELLTGKTPFEAKDLLEVGLDAMRRIIRETDPPRPSTRLTTLSREELSTTAQRRGLEAPKLVCELRRDLDWIIMKALEKDRKRRYETANGLAMDVARHLNNEPVIACPPSRLYRFCKLVRRNKLVFVAGCAVLAALAIGLALSTILFFRERAAREQADEQAEIAQAWNTFLQQDLLSQSSGESQLETGFTTNPELTLREALEIAAERIDRFKDHPLQEATVRRTIGKAFQDMGEAKRAISHLERALQLDQSELSPHHPETLKVRNDLGNAYFRVGEVDKALQFLEETLDLMKAEFGPDDPATLLAAGNLATWYHRTRKLKKAVQLLEETLELTKAKLGPDHPQTIETMNKLSIAYTWADKRIKAMDIGATTLKLCEAKYGPEHPSTWRSMYILGDIYIDAERPGQGIPLLEKAFELANTYLGPEHEETLSAMRILGSGYSAEKAIPLMEKALILHTAVLGPVDPHTLRAMNILANAYSSTGKSDKAFPLLKQVQEGREAVLGPDHPDTLRSLIKLANAHHKAGNRDEALSLFKQALKRCETKLGPNHHETIGAMLSLAKTIAGYGELEEATEMFHEYVDRVSASEDPRDLRSAAWDLATIKYPAWRDGVKAVAYAEKAVAHPGRRTPHYLNTLAAAYAEAGKFEEAVKAQKEAIALLGIGSESNEYAQRLLLYQSSVPYRRGWSVIKPVLALLEARRFVETESLARELLLIREIFTPDNWRTFHLKSILGGSLLGQQKYAEAEPLLLEGYEGMRERQEQLTTTIGKLSLKDALQRLVELYEEIGPPDRATRWQQELIVLEEKLVEDNPETEAEEK